MSELSARFRAEQILHAGQDLSDREKSQIQRHPQVGRRLVRHVPRLDAVSLMVGGYGQSREAVILKMHCYPSQYDPSVLSALALLIQDRQLVADYGTTADEQGADPGEQQVFRPLAEQVLQALRD
jgi:hypothetical protein